MWGVANWWVRPGWSWSPACRTCAPRTPCSRRCCGAGAPSRLPAACTRTRSSLGCASCGGSWPSPTSIRGAGDRRTWRSGPCRSPASGISPRRRSAATRSTCACSASTSPIPATAGDPRARTPSAPATIRCRSATSGTRSRTSTTTRAVPRRGPSAGRSCRCSSTSRTTRWSVRSPRGARGCSPPTGTRRCSRSSTGGGCAGQRRPSSIWSTSAPTRPRRSSAGSACCTSATARRPVARRLGGAMCCRSWVGRSTRWWTTSRTSGPASAFSITRRCG